MKQTSKATLLALLRRRWVTPLDSAQNGGGFALSQRVGEFRSVGVCIIDKWVKTESGARVKAYRIVKPTKWTA
jgi:hypothetical protein